jgi:hypothetical protein
MTVFALIAGRLHGDPVIRPTRTGGEVTFFKLKVANGSALEWRDCASFSHAVRDELAGLSEGAPLSASGGLHVGTFEHNGETRISRKLTVDRLLSLKPTPEEQKRGSEEAAARPASRSGREIAAALWAATALEGAR